MSSAAISIRNRTTAAVQEIYRPILRGYFIAFALYYMVMLPMHIIYFEGAQRLSMSAAAAAAATVAFGGASFMQRAQPQVKVEALLCVLNLLVVANIVIALSFEFAASKLVYFVIIGVGFSIASVSARQAIFSLAAAGLALIGFVVSLHGNELRIIAFIAIGATIASLSIAWLIRREVFAIAQAKIQGEDELAEARMLGQTLEKQSFTDSLTGLPNRRAFFAKFRSVVVQLKAPGADETNATPWLMLVDLDGFKSVNDVHGHLTGDLLLKEVSDRLRSFGGDNALVSRMGGDEFNIICDCSEPLDQLLDRCERLLATISAPYLIEGRSIRISASIGLRMIDASCSMREQINQADFALMVAKRQGRNRAIVFNGQLAEQSEARARVEMALRRADFYQEIDLVYQPQFHLGTDTIIRAEVLARWVSASIGPIEPDRFITIAEESGLITDITLTVVEKAFREIAAWPVPLPVSLNLSSHDVISKPTIERIIALAEEHEIDPSRVEFEVTETAMMADVDKAITHLEMLGRTGFSIALDDFGTGYSNFSYLRSLPISKLKVDRSFIENPGDPMTEKILSSLAGMARILGVHCLLEGIEDEIGLLMARRAGAESVQGYLFGKPMAATDLLAKVQGSVANDRTDTGLPQGELDIVG